MRAGAVIVAALLAAACNPTPEESTTPAEEARPQAMAGSERPTDDQGQCPTEGEDLEISEYDTTGDDYPDVRRVFQRVGDPGVSRLILVCREVDLNGDGIKDIVRFYNDEGRPTREEADRDLDGAVDSITYFANGRIVRRELDTTRDGRVDTKVYFEDGEIVRTERDLSARSSAEQWRPNRWEYFDDGRMVRMGTDVDGDGTVDRWDRDYEWAAQQERVVDGDAPPEEELEAAGADAAGQDGEGDGGGETEEPPADP